ncbi:MAG TPA: transporter substrate-binding domain-containing protein [Azospirillaceae bacterium]|nr:transporter substrate-binding domain-containing protein [Azospirillaceae bacterium]
MRLKVLGGALLAAAMGGSSAWADTVTLRADAWCPYNCDPKSGMPGYMVEIADAAMARLGHRVDYALMPWDDAMAAVKDGRSTGIIGTLYGEATAEGLLLPRVPLALSGTTLAVRKGLKFKYAGLPSLAGIRLAVIEGYAYDDGPIDAYIRDNRGKPGIVVFEGEDASDKIVAKLAAGEVDAMVEDTNVLDYVLTTQGLGGLFDLIAIAEPAPLTIAFTPADPKSAGYAEALSAEVEAMRRDGRLAAVLKKYGLRDWAPGK